MPALGVPAIVSTIYAGVHDAAHGLDLHGSVVVEGMKYLWPIVIAELHTAIGDKGLAALEDKVLAKVRSAVAAEAMKLPGSSLFLEVLDHAWPLVEAEAKKLVDAAPGAA